MAKAGRKAKYNEKMGKVSVRLPNEIKSIVDALALLRGTSRSEIIVTLLMDGVTKIVTENNNFVGRNMLNFQGVKDEHSVKP